MRLRIPELLEKRELTPYYLALKSGGRISLSTAYRLVNKEGRVKMFDAALAEALCELLGVGPGELFELEADASHKPSHAKAKTAKGQKRPKTA